MTSVHGLMWLVIAFSWGSVHGWIFFQIAFWRRAGLYVRNDEYRIGFFAMSVVGSLSIFRIVESYILTHHPFYQWTWAISWAFVYCVGITWGFSRGVGPKHIDPISNAQPSGPNSALTPLTGLPDE